MAIFYTCQTGGHIVYDVIGKTLGTGDNLKLSKIHGFFLSYTTITLWKNILRIAISNLEENQFSSPVKLVVILSKCHWETPQL